jgi:GNAT superfamily N-acetyltransferase
MNEIRLLRQEDIPGAMHLSRAAGWNQTEADWARILRLEPEGCFAIEQDGQVACTATAIAFGAELGWIGMVLTDPAHRGKGLATRLMVRAIEWLEERRVQWIKLDATDMGRPIYLKLGFEDEAIVERWARAPGLAPRTGAGPLRVDWDLDREAFGADRSRLLEDLARTGVAAANGSGYAFGRPGDKAAYFGPCVCRNAEGARNLLQWFLGEHADQTVFWDILTDNREAIDLALEFGFERRRRLTRQVRPGVPAPAPFRRRDEYVYAIAGFEYG